MQLTYVIKFSKDTCSKHLKLISTLECLVKVCYYTASYGSYHLITVAQMLMFVEAIVAPLKNILAAN